MHPVRPLIRSFSTDRRAVSAVEFALILPVLLLLLLASFDVTRAVDAKNKSVLLARTIADFVSQDRDGVTQNELANIIKASKFVLYPYPDTSSVLTITIESVNQATPGPPPTYQIDWSYSPSLTPAANPNNRATTIAIPDVSSIRATVRYVYKLKFVGYLTDSLGFSQIVLNSTTNMSPRWGTPVTANGW